MWNKIKASEGETKLRQPEALLIKGGECSTTAQVEDLRKQASELDERLTELREMSLVGDGVRRRPFPGLR